MVFNFSYTLLLKINWEKNKTKHHHLEACISSRKRNTSVTLGRIPQLSATVVFYYVCSMHK